MQDNKDQGLKGLQLPRQLELAEEPVINWKLFRRRWDNYVTLSNLSKQPESYKVALFLTCLGDNALKLYDGFDFVSPEEDRTVEEILERFETFAVGQINETYERAIFNKRSQMEGESFENFLAALRSLIKSCGFCDKCKDSLLRDRIVVGIRDPLTHTELVKQRTLTLLSCIDICRSADKASREEAVLRPNYVNAIKRNTKPIKVPDIKFLKCCKYCGKSHLAKKEECPAWSHVCNKCSKSNHFESVCLSDQFRKRKSWQSNPVQQMDYSDHVSENLSIQTEDKIAWINTVSQLRNLRIAKCALEVNGKRIIFQIDSGSSVNLLPYSLVSTPSKIMHSTRRLKMWNNSELNAFGTIITDVRNPKNGDVFTLEFVIVKEQLAPLIGLNACLTMNIINLREDNIDLVSSVSAIQRIPAFTKFEAIFEEEIGKFPGLVKLHVNHAIVPVVSPPRRTPIALRSKLRQELDRLIAQKVIANVSHPTDWVNQFVIVPKQDGTIRLCIDPVHLNRALRREHFTLPTVDDVLHELAESDTFSKCDLRWGFLHVELEQESSYLTTFQTPFGRFLFFC